MVRRGFGGEGEGGLVVKREGVWWLKKGRGKDFRMGGRYLIMSGEG